MRVAGIWLALAVAPVAAVGCGDAGEPLRSVTNAAAAPSATYALLGRPDEARDRLPPRTAGGAASPSGIDFAAARLARIADSRWRVWATWSKAGELCVFAFTPIDSPLASSPGGLCGPPGSRSVGVAMTIGGTRAGGAGLPPHATEIVGVVPDGPGVVDIVERDGTRVRPSVRDNVFHARLPREVERVSYVVHGRIVFIPVPAR